MTRILLVEIRKQIVSTCMATNVGQIRMSDLKTSQSLSVKDQDFDEAASVIRRSLSARRLIIVVGNCRVDYEGRASSSLGWGERVLMVKEDGSVLVHRSSGYEPVNWQPSKCLFRVEAEKESLHIVASRPRQKEMLSVHFDRILSLDCYDLSDQAKFNLYVSEEQMKEAILARPDLIEDGFRPIVSEKNLGQAGFTDIMGEDSDRNLVVVEIKRVPAGRESVTQLNRYLSSIRKDLGRGLRGIIAAPELRKGTQGLLATMNLEFREVSLRKCAEILAQRQTRKLSEFL